MVITGKDTVDICKLFLVRKKYEMNYSIIGQVKCVEDIYKISLRATLSNISLLIKLPWILEHFSNRKEFTVINSQTRKNNLWATADELFECV